MLALDVNPPRVVDEKYQLEELIGLGSMGEVWLARHVGLGQPCAVKLMTPDAHEEAEAALVRFRREARACAALSQKTRHIVRVTDFGADTHGPYLVMELLEGESLADRMKRGPCTEGEAAEIVGQIASALAVAHREGVVHRDLKPANVFLTRGEDGHVVVKVLDFGIARLLALPANSLTVAGVVVGTPAYMSPEHVMGEAIDARADVWSLAVVAHELVTGTSPFAAETVEETLKRIMSYEVAPPPKKLRWFFDRAFARDAEHRFRSATQLSRAFGQAMSGRAPSSSNRPVVIAAVCSAAITIAAAVLARFFLF